MRKDLYVSYKACQSEVKTLLSRVPTHAHYDAEDILQDMILQAMTQRSKCMYSRRLLLWKIKRQAWKLFWEHPSLESMDAAPVEKLEATQETHVDIAKRLEGIDVQAAIESERDSLVYGAGKAKADRLTRLKNCE